MIVTTGFNFVALQYLQLDQTVTIFFLAPLLVALLAGPLLHEWVGWHRMVAIVAGFLGVLLVMHPGIGTLHWAMLIALVATLGYALYNLVDALPRRLRSAGGDADLHAACRRHRADAVRACRLGAAGKPDGVAAPCLARLLGRARALAAHPRASHRAGLGARAVHLSRPDLDVVRRLSRVRPGADMVDAERRGDRDPLRPLSLRAASARCSARRPSAQPPTSPRSEVWRPQSRHAGESWHPVFPEFVMAGLVPAIHDFSRRRGCPAQAGHDAERARSTRRSARATSSA